MTQVVLESFSVQKNEQELSLKVVHVNLHVNLSVRPHCIGQSFDRSE